MMGLSVNTPHGRPRPVWLVDAQSTVSSITGDQPIKRPHPRDPIGIKEEIESNKEGPADLDVVSGIGVVDSGGGSSGSGADRSSQESSKASKENAGSSSTSTTTTLRPPPWLKTNVTKNATTTTTTTTTTSTTTTTTTQAPTSEVSSSSSSSHHIKQSKKVYSDSNLPDLDSGDSLDDEQLLEDMERQNLFEEQDRLLEEELSHSFPKSSSDRSQEAAATPG